VNDSFDAAGGGTWPPADALHAAVSSTLDEGVQLWDIGGRMSYANRATFRQLGVGQLEPAALHTGLRGLLLASNGRGFEDGQFPVQRVLATGRPCPETLVQVAHAGAMRWLRMNAYPFAAGGSRGAVLTTTVEVTRFVDEARRLELQAHYDPLTMLPNRALLGDRMSQGLARARRNNEMLAVCILDLDGFKPVNDTLGHDAGDRLLQEIARRLRDCVRGEDTVSRLGGDEFALLIGGIKSLAQAQLVFNRLLALVSLPVSIGNQIAQVSGSLGATVFPMDASDPDALLTHADEAMYRAKEGGKNRFHLFDMAMESRIAVNQRTVQQMETALAAGEFDLYYQPIVDCHRGVVVGMEALARWEHPTLGTRLPHEFLPVIEQEELIIRLGEWAVERALAQNRRWRDAGFRLQLDVNISPLHVMRGDLEKLLTRLGTEHPREAVQALRFEIVASATGHQHTLGPAIERCCATGVGFVLDEFGSGQSSLPHLIALGAGTLKIGRRYVGELSGDPRNLAIVRGIIGLGEAFQRRVVAVGVESTEHVTMLLELGCDAIQGHAIAPPMRADDVLPWLRAFRPDPRWAAALSGYPTRADFDLLVQQVTHRDWYARLRRRLGGEPAAGEAHPQEHGDCPFTRWCDEAGWRRYRNAPEFQTFLTVHREVHDVAERLLEAPGDDAALGALERAHEELLGRLHAFRISVARREPLHPAP
jgi:diguanylate cyclase (GGDEF)-like protein